MPKLMKQAVEISPLDTDATVEVLNRILHFELNGVMQHFHHRWMSRWLGLRGRARSRSGSTSPRSRARRRSAWLS